MSVWAMGDDLKTLQRSAEADVNLVVSAVGLRVAKILWEKYKIPYVIGTPNDWLAEDISNALERAATRQAESRRLYICRTACSRRQISRWSENLSLWDH